MANQPKNYKKFVATAATATLVASAIVPVASAASFSDIEDNTHADAIKALSDAGIIKGYEDGTFKPNAEISRGQTVKLLGRWLETKGYKVPGNWNTVQRFNDLPVNAADSELVKYAALVKDAGVFNGSNGNLNYSQPMQRQQMALVLVRAIKTVEGIDLIKEYKDAGYTSKIKDLDKAYSTENVEAITALEYAGITVVENFNPTSAITRGQFASFLNRTINYEAPVKELKVESVSAINAKQIQVTFSGEVDSLTALNPDNYKIQTNADAQPVALSSKDATAELELSDDGKVVTITTTTQINDAFKTGTTAIVAGTPFKFTVDGVTAKDGSEIEAKTFTISSDDKVAPSFLTASAKAKTTTTRVTLEFSEPVDVNGAIAYVGGQAATVAQGNTPTTVILTTAQALEANKEYDLTLLNFKDFAGNFLDKNPTNTKFTVSSDTVAPVVQDVKVVRDNLIEVTFDKAMDVSSFSGNARILDANGIVQGGSLGAAIKPGTGNKTVRLVTTLAVPFNENGTFTGTLVLGDGIKDSSGNTKSATSHNITLTKDTVKPTLEGASYVAPNGQYAGNTYANGAIVLKFSEEVSATNTPANYKIISSAGEEVTTPAISSVAVNGLNAKEVILTMSGNLPADTYTVRVANEAVQDLSTQQNKNVAAVTTVKVDGSSDTSKPTVALSTNAASAVVAATNQTSGSKIVLTMKDNVGLDLDTVQNVTNYLLNGKPLPSGSYITIAHNAGSNSSAATDIEVTLNIPEKSIVKDDNYTLNVNNIKDKAGNVANPFVQNNVALKDDISPELTKAEISSNGLLVLSFSEAVNGVAAGTGADFQFTINGTKVVVANNGNIATFADGTGTDTGKYVVTFKAAVDAGADGNAATTADNRLFINVDGSVDSSGNPTYTPGDILLLTGTTTAVGPVTALDVNMLTSLEVEVVNDTTVKDTSTLTNPIKKGTKIKVK